MSKPERIGTVWTAWAQIQIIDDRYDPPRWVTVESCIDTPHAIGNALAKARKTHYGKRMWVKQDMAGRKIA